MSFFILRFVLRRSLADDLRRTFAKLCFPSFLMGFMYWETCGNIGELPFLTLVQLISSTLSSLVLTMSDLISSGRLRTEGLGLRLR